MPRKKKKSASRAKSRKKSPQRRPASSKRKRDRFGRFLASRKTPRKSQPKQRGKKSPPKARRVQRKESALFPVTDFEFVDESEAGDFEQYFGDEDLDFDDEEEEGDELEELEEEEDDDTDYDFEASASDDIPIILGEWNEEMSDVELDEIESMPPDDISEAVWEEILGEDFGFDDMAEMYDDGDVYEFEVAISYGEAA